MFLPSWFDWKVVDDIPKSLWKIFSDLSVKIFYISSVWDDCSIEVIFAKVSLLVALKVPWRLSMIYNLQKILEIQKNILIYGNTSFSRFFFLYHATFSSDLSRFKSAQFYTTIQDSLSQKLFFPFIATMPTKRSSKKTSTRLRYDVWKNI